MWAGVTLLTLGERPGTNTGLSVRGYDVGGIDVSERIMDAAHEHRRGLRGVKLSRGDALEVAE